MTLTEFLVARWGECEASERSRMRQRRDVNQPYTVEFCGPDPGWTRFKMSRDDYVWDSLGDDEFNKRFMESVPDVAVLADLASKRAILDLCERIMENEPAEGWYQGASPVGVARLTKLYLATPYADHPDYREEWRP